MPGTIPSPSSDTDQSEKGENIMKVKFMVIR